MGRKQRARHQHRIKGQFVAADIGPQQNHGVVGCDGQGRVDLAHRRSGCVASLDQPIGEPRNEEAVKGHRTMGQQEQLAVVLVGELEYAGGVLGQVSHEDVAAPVATHGARDQGPKGARGQQVAPRYGRWVRMGVGLKFSPEMVGLAFRNEGMGGGTVVAENDPEYEPDARGHAREVEDRGPAEVVDEGTVTGCYQEDASGRAQVDDRGDLGALVGWNPLGQKHAHGGLGHALAETREGLENDEEGRAAPGYGAWSDEGAEGGQNDADAEGVFATKFFGDQTAGNVGEDVAPVE